MATDWQAMSLMAFWGKAQPLHQHGAHYHPLPYHALDVTAVGKQWLEHDGRLAAWLAERLGMPVPHLAALLCPLLALHDIGKFAAAFQSKAPDYFPLAAFGGRLREPAIGFRHDAAGFRFFSEEFSKTFPFWTSDDRFIVLPLLKAVTGHHGEPPPDSFNGRLLDDYWPQGLEAAKAFCHSVVDLLGRPKLLPDENTATQASSVLAGFAIACDWLGSNQQHFAYAEPSLGLAEYWDIAQDRARNALRAAALIGAPPAAPVSLASLLKVDDAEPSALQHWSAKADLPDGPLLILLEDETGSGKTEAALILASRLMARGDASGIYTALPTMATANALFDRLSACYRQLFEADAAPSLALVHGRSHMLSAFRALDFGNVEKSEHYGSEDSASTLCSAWLGDDRRKAFLADVGVGTIDQAVLSILPARFQALRLFGLTRKVLILDEVHAYDAFVSQELERLIEWQAALGGPCVLLSATLPIAVRQRLVRAFRRALDGSSVDVVETAYPLATIVSGNRYQASAVDGRSRRARHLPVRFLGNPDQALELARKAAADGKALAYIRNTVDDAIEAYAQLREQGVDALLFHARMALIDRFKVESDVLRLFGKSTSARSRSGKLLVATQVIEQSLDLDFDAMISDLAPVDLIVQRAGRLWRHERPGREGSPELHVVSPEPVPDADRHWYGRLLPRAQWVYRDHARLWLTADVLRHRGAIDSPDGVRSLIEDVYGDEAEGRIPEALRSSRMEVEGKSSAQRGQANRQILDPRLGYVRTGPWEDDARATTRLEERPQVTLRLAVVVNGALAPYADTIGNTGGLAESGRWTLSEVQVSGRRAHEETLPPELVAAAEAARSTWGRFDQSKLLLVLRPQIGNSFSGFVRDADGNIGEVKYSPEYGLAFSKT